MTKRNEPLIGKRKRAIAKAFVRKGGGRIKINGQLLENLRPEMARLMIKEPLMLVDELSQKVDVDVNVKGGGVIGQAEAARQAIALGLIEFGGKKYRQVFEDYDRHLLVKDSRRTEPHKPSRSSAGPRRHKQRSKR